MVLAIKILFNKILYNKDRRIFKLQIFSLIKLEELWMKVFCKIIRKLQVKKEKELMEIHKEVDPRKKFNFKITLKQKRKNKERINDLLYTYLYLLIFF